MRRAVIKAERILLKLRELFASGKQPPYDIDRVVKDDLLNVLDIDLTTTLPPPSHGNGTPDAARMPFLLLLSTKFDDASGVPLPAFLSNYARPHTPPTFHWPAWLLVKLTSAAPGSFPAVCIEGHIYKDGAMVGNNPVDYGFQEAARLLSGGRA